MRNIHFTITEWFLVRWLMESVVWLTYRPWKWCDGGKISFSLSCARNFSRNFKGNGCQNCQCYCKKQIDNNFSKSLLLSTMEMMTKYSKLCCETTHLQLVVDLLTSPGERREGLVTSHTHPTPPPDYFKKALQLTSKQNSKATLATRWTGSFWSSPKW